MPLKLNEPISQRKAMIVLTALAAGVAVIWGGWIIYARVTHRPPSTATVKSQIWSYLKKQTGESEFKTSLDLSGITNQTVTVTFTNRAGKVRTVERRWRGGRQDLPETSVSHYFRTNQASAATYEGMYRLIGEELKIADDLLDKDEWPGQITGLILASEASTYARDNAMNLWLAARICQAYLWPHLSLLERTNNAPITAGAVLNICEAAFQEAGETNNMIRNYEYLLSETARPQQADGARFRLARLYEDVGEDEKALKLLKQITSFKNPRLERQIAALERRLKQKK